MSRLLLSVETSITTVCMSLWKPRWNSVATEGKRSRGLWPHRRVTLLTVEGLLWEPFPHRRNNFGLLFPLLSNACPHTAFPLLPPRFDPAWRPTPDACARLSNLQNHIQKEISLFTIHTVWNSVITQGSKLRSLAYWDGDLQSSNMTLSELMTSKQSFTEWLGTRASVCQWGETQSNQNIKYRGIKSFGQKHTDGIMELRVRTQEVQL